MPFMRASIASMPSWSLAIARGEGAARARRADAPARGRRTRDGGGGARRREGDRARKRHAEGRHRGASIVARTALRRTASRALSTCSRRGSRSFRPPRARRRHDARLWRAARYTMSCDVKHPGSGRHALLEVAAPLGRRCSVPSTPRTVPRRRWARTTRLVARLGSRRASPGCASPRGRVRDERHVADGRRRDAERGRLRGDPERRVRRRRHRPGPHARRPRARRPGVSQDRRASTSSRRARPIPRKSEGAVEEQVASRYGGCFGDVENYLFAGPVANVLAAPRPPSSPRWRTSIANPRRRASTRRFGPRRRDAAARASGAGPALAAADTAKTLDAVAALDIPDDPEAVIASYVEAALMRIPDEILAHAPRTRCWARSCDFRGRGDSAAGGGSGGPSGGVAFELIGGLLLACGVMGAVAVEVTFCATRTARAALRSLVETCGGEAGGGNAVAAAGKRAGEAWKAGKAAVSDGAARRRMVWRRSGPKRRRTRRRTARRRMPREVARQNRAADAPLARFSTSRVDGIARCVARLHPRRSPRVRVARSPPPLRQPWRWRRRDGRYASRPRDRRGGRRNR